MALKLYPVLLMPMVTLWAWQSGRPHARREALVSSLLGGGLVVLTFGTLWWVARPQVEHMVWYHSARPLEVESVGATAAWLLGPTGSTFTFGSANITTAFEPVIIKLLTAVNVVAATEGKARPLWKFLALPVQTIPQWVAEATGIEQIGYLTNLKSPAPLPTFAGLEAAWEQHFDKSAEQKRRVLYH